MSAPEVWRNRKKRLRLTGFQRENGKGETEVSLTGISWHNLTEQQVKIKGSEGTIYESEQPLSPNGNKKPIAVDKFPYLPAEKKTTSN